MAEIPPSARPSQIAYSGAVMAAQIFLKTVISAVTKPPSTPSINQPDTAPGSRASKNWRHGTTAAAISKASRMPVLLTVPWIVISSPCDDARPNVVRAPRAKPPKDFEFNAGFAVRIMGSVYPWFFNRPVTARIPRQRLHARRAAKHPPHAQPPCRQQGRRQRQRRRRPDRRHGGAPARGHAPQGARPGQAAVARERVDHA